MIPRKTEQRANRKNRGSKGRNLVERGFDKLKDWRDPATPYGTRLDLPRRHGLASILCWLKA